MALPALALAAIKAAPSLIQGGIGLANSISSGIQQRGALRDLENTDYVDYTQKYFDELQARSRRGLPMESLDYAETGIDRAFGAGMANMEDRRAGLIGVGSSSMGLADAYRQLAASDAEVRMQNEANMIAEMGKRGETTYNEDAGLANVKLALARSQGMEGKSAFQSSIQTAVNEAGASMSGGADSGSLQTLFTEFMKFAQQSGLSLSSQT
jgi:hypothetical protein